MGGNIRLKTLWRASRQGTSTRSNSTCRLAGCDGREDITHHLVSCRNHGVRLRYERLCQRLLVAPCTNDDDTAAQLLAFKLGHADTSTQDKQDAVLEYLADIHLIRFKTNNNE